MKTKSPQTNGTCERFHKTILSEFYQIAFREKIYESIKMQQNDLGKLFWIRRRVCTAGNIAMGKRRCRRSRIPSLLQKWKCCSIVTTFQTKRKYDGSSENVVTSTDHHRLTAFIFWQIPLQKNLPLIPLAMEFGGRILSSGVYSFKRK